MPSPSRIGEQLFDSLDVYSASLGSKVGDTVLALGPSQSGHAHQHRGLVASTAPSQKHLGSSGVGRSGCSTAAAAAARQAAHVRRDRDHDHDRIRLRLCSGELSSRVARRRSCIRPGRAVRRVGTRREHPPPSPGGARGCGRRRVNLRPRQRHVRGRVGLLSRRHVGQRRPRGRPERRRRRRRRRERSGVDDCRGRRAAREHWLYQVGQRRQLQRHTLGGRHAARDAGPSRSRPREARSGRGRRRGWVSSERRGQPPRLDRLFRPGNSKLRLSPQRT